MVDVWPGSVRDVTHPQMGQWAAAPPPVQRHDLVMFDLDGVVYRGDDAVPAAIDSIAVLRRQGTPVAFVTNNASRTAADVASHLIRLGLRETQIDDVVTAAQAVARMMSRALPPSSEVLVVGGPGLREPLEAHGLTCVSRRTPETVAVVQGFHADLGWRDLAEAAYAVQAGLPWFASNADLTVPTPQGIAPGNGSLIRLVSTTVGDRWPQIAGKPERGLFDETLARFSAEAPLMVGDRPDTDIDGAIAAGLDSLLVLTGVASLADVIALPISSRPTYVAPDLRGLLVEHPVVTWSATRAECGASRVVATETSHGWGVEWEAGEPGSLATIRTAVALGWSIVDRGGVVSSVDGRLGL